MNAIPFLSAQPWVERLGAALLHFLWQGVLIAAVYAAARRWTARSSGANVRYVLACAALALLAAVPVLTWILLRPAAPGPVTIPVAAPVSAVASTAVRNLPALVFAGTDPLVPPSFLPWVVAVWLMGAMVFWLRLTGGWISAQRLRSRSVRPAPPGWQQAFDRLRTRMLIARPVRLLVSALVEVPVVVGWLRPVVLVPVGVLAGLPPEQIEALLLHELAHIRRHDYLVNLMQSAVEALLFYHPAVWWISGHIRAERELCCDHVAVSVHGSALTYALALAELESARPAHRHPVLAATGGSLAYRITRLMGQSRPTPRTFSGPGIIAAAVFLALTGFALFGQPVALPRFEVASIKPSVAAGLRTVRPLPGRLTADANVRLLLQSAYTVQSYQIAGGPPWIDADRYELDAKAAGNPSRAQMFLMLQSLLEGRFQLKIHREARELPVYDLVAARSGLKLRPPQENGCVNPDPDAPMEWAGGRMLPPEQGQKPAARCGTVSVVLQLAGARMQGGKLHMADLVRQLSLVLGRTVIDQTGFTERFDVQLDFQPDDTTPALPPPPPGTTGAPPDSGSPSILTALQQQLGLRLESARGPVEVIVIDHIERPSAN